MYAGAFRRIVQGASGTSTSSAVSLLFVNEPTHDIQGVVIPRPEVHLAVRFGPSTRAGIDLHAMGGRQVVHRKLLRSGHRVVMARLHLGAAQAVLGVPDAAIAGRIVALEDLLGDAPTRRLLERFADARDTLEVATILESAVAERLALAKSHGARTQLVLAAADRLSAANVNAVANDLGVSERHLRRVFHETIGVGPKTFAKLSRFRRALRSARDAQHANWANIAIATGYYDQAHLITEFRAISGVTPQTLLSELRAAQSLA